MNASEILGSLSYQERKVLLALAKLGDGASPEGIFEAGPFGQMVEVMNAASWLQSKGLITMEERGQKVYGLKAKDIAQRGLPERRALDYIGRNITVKMGDLDKALDKGEVPVAIGWLRKKNLVKMEKTQGETVITLTDAGKEALVQEMRDEALLKRMAVGEISERDAPADIIAQLKGRQDLITERLQVARKMSLTELGRQVLDLGVVLKEEVAQITPELLQSGKWKEVSFRRYDVRTFAPTEYAAKKHPLTRIADEVRRIFLQMGFTEIDEEYVQPAFWNMDTLFTPQDHPAREMQDTFYLKHPSKLSIADDEELIKKVRSIHETGGDSGSLGWRYKWSRAEAERALLRTHTTVNTIRYLAKHPNPPVKVFSLSRVFRKEAIDATHLPEFMQIEGIVMEETASFDMLVGILREFYSRMGFEDIRVRPGYFPYTEPSLEVEVLWNDKWMELGGAGIFRPEVTAPYGIKHPVLAWGQGFERLAMLRWGLKDIRELYATDMDLLRQSPIF